MSFERGKYRLKSTIHYHIGTEPSISTPRSEQDTYRLSSIMWRSFSRRNDDVTQILDSLDLPGVAKYIKSDNCKQIFIMVCPYSDALPNR